MGTFLEQNVTDTAKDSPTQILSICSDPVGTSGSCAGRACHSQSRRSEGRSFPRRSTMILVRRKKCAWSLFKVKTLRISHNWGELGLHRTIKIRGTVPLKVFLTKTYVFAMQMSRYPRYVMILMIWRPGKKKESKALHLQIIPGRKKKKHHQAVEGIGFGGGPRRKVVDTEIC